MVLQSVLMAFDLVLMTAVIPIIQKVESGKDRILKARLSTVVGGLLAGWL